MAINLPSDEAVKSKSSVSNYNLDTKQAYQFIKAWNQVQEANGNISNLIHVDGAKDLEKIKSEYNEYRGAVKSKAITGASAATGSGLISQTYDIADLSMVAIELGDAARSSGIPFKSGVKGTYNKPGFQGFGDYQASTPGSALTADVAVNVGVIRPINPALYQAEIPVYDDPIFTDYVGNRGQLIAMFQQVLNIKKGTLRDNLLFTDLTSNPTGLTISTPSSATYFPIAQSINALVSRLRRFAQAGPVKIYVNQFGLTRIINEQDQMGNFSNQANFNTIMKFTPARADMAMPEVGLAGRMCGAEVHVVPAIKNTYTVNASGAVTAQTGGSNTIVAVGITNAAAVIAGDPADDFITVFDATNDRAAFREATTSVAARTYAGAGIMNPYMWGYYSFIA